MIQVLDKLRATLYLPKLARAELFKDLMGLPASTPSIERAVDEAIQWLCRAQDHSKTRDEGIAYGYSLISGWSSSYPETTGYCIPTMLTCARIRQNEELRSRARRMLNWLLSIQFADGSFQGGMVDSEPVVSVAFNTGQILHGLAAGAVEFGEPYLSAMHRAADWLVTTQDADGCWRKHPSPFAAPGEKAYDTYVASALLTAEQVTPGRGYQAAGLANIRWALTAQEPNGWFGKCCLTHPTAPLTHTIGYVLRGVLEGYRFSKDMMLLHAGRKTADALLSVIGPDGFIPGRLRSDWSGAVSWACLTGTVQIAHCWLLLYADTGEARYRDAACLANRYVRRTLCLDGSDDVRGGVKGAFPVYGDYLSYLYPNWACKFFLDSHLLELTIRDS